MTTVITRAPFSPKSPSVPGDPYNEVIVTNRRVYILMLHQTSNPINPGNPLAPLGPNGPYTQYTYSLLYYIIINNYLLPIQ